MDLFSIEFTDVITGFERDAAIGKEYCIKAENAKTKFGRAWYNMHSRLAYNRAERKFLQKLLNIQ